MSHKPLPAYFILFAVVRRDDKFLMIQERKHNEGWYLPAGKAELGESLVAAIQREAIEEAGVPIIIEGVLKVHHTTVMVDVWQRIIFLASPADDTPPRTIPNEHSLGAKWVTLEEARELPLRSIEALRILEWAATNPPVYPVSIFDDDEGLFA